MSESGGALKMPIFVDKSASLNRLHTCMYVFLLRLLSVLNLNIFEQSPELLF